LDTELAQEFVRLRTPSRNITSNPLFEGRKVKRFDVLVLAF